MVELVFATALDGIVTFVLFLIWQNERDIRGRLLPLCQIGRASCRERVSVGV